MSQQSNYSNLNVQATLSKVKEKALNIFGAILRYYEGREKEFRSLFPNLTDAEFTEFFADVVGQFSNKYKNFTKTGFKIVDELSEVLNQSVQIQEEYIKKKDKMLTGSAVAAVNSIYEKNKKDLEAVTSKVNIQRAKRISTIKSVQVVDYTSNTLRQMGYKDANQLAGEVLLYLVDGDTEATRAAIRDIEKVIKIVDSLNNIQKTAIDNQIQLFINPFKSKNKEVKKFVIGGSAGGWDMSKNYGAAVNEPVTVNLFKSLIDNAHGNMRKSAIANLTGNKDVSKDVSDGTLAFEVDVQGGVFVAGIDVKYSRTKRRGYLKYYRKGGADRPVGELEPLFEDNMLTDLTYLLSNLYYYNPKTESDEYFQNVLDVARFIQGLLVLLPPQKQKNQVKPLDLIGGDGILKTLTQDTRIFVSINENLMLMTSFLKAVEDSVFNLELKRNTGIKTLKSTLNQVLGAIQKSNQVGKLTKVKGITKPTGTFYENKLAILAGLTGDVVTYAELHDDVVSKVLGNKIDAAWKYKPIADSLWVKKAKL
jgi:hypothetical protein